MLTEDLEAIIFDFGGVIINIDYNATIDAFKALGIDNFEELYSQADQSNLFDDIETGKISPQHFINGLLHLLPAGTTANQVVQAWNAMILDVPAERIELLLELRSKHKIYLLSNTNAIHIDCALRRWNNATNMRMDQVFNHVYFSHEMRMRKPSVGIFNEVCAGQGLYPKNTLFVDDSIQHIEGAKQIGLRTYHLTNGETIHDVFS
jgi:putative hydrolase of the HAD superfamily